MQDKQRIDNAIILNREFRDKCIKALIETKAYFDKKMKGKR